jgi:hypothetical protein
MSRSALLDMAVEVRAFNKRNLVSKWPAMWNDIEVCAGRKRVGEKTLRGMATLAPALALVHARVCSGAVPPHCMPTGLKQLYLIAGLQKLPDDAQADALVKAAIAKGSSLGDGRRMRRREAGDTALVEAAMRACAAERVAELQAAALELRDSVAQGREPHDTT